MHVEVAYARPEKQAIIELELEAGMTARQAVERSGILEQFPEIDLDSQKIGIFGKLVPLDHVLREGDRIEIYRKLIADPKQARKKRAAKTKSANKPEKE